MSIHNEKGLLTKNKRKIFTKSQLKQNYFDTVFRGWRIKDWKSWGLKKKAMVLRIKRKNQRGIKKVTPARRKT